MGLASTDAFRNLKRAFDRDRKALLLFQQRVESEMQALSNKGSGEGKRSSNNLNSTLHIRFRSQNSYDQAILADLERVEGQMSQVKMELNGFKTRFQVDRFKTTSFFSLPSFFQVLTRSGQEDAQKVWDNLNELQEITNITTRNIEDIYDKDILKLQNFQNTVKEDLRKMRYDLATALKNGAVGGRKVNNSVSEGEKKLEYTVLEIQEEMKQLKVKTQGAHGLSDSFRNELNSINIEMDELNKEKQANAMEIEHLKRYISKLEVEKVEENENKIKGFARKLETLEVTAGRTNQRMKKMGKKSQDNEKVDLLLKEVQSVKNQVYFLQQAILQLRAQVGRSKNF